MKRYIIGLCFVAASLANAATEPSKTGRCSQLAQRMMPALRSSRIVYPHINRNYISGIPHITDRLLLGATPCPEAWTLTLWRVSNVLEEKKVKLGKQQQELEHCLAESPDQAQDVHVIEVSRELKNAREYLNYQYRALDECRKLKGAVN